MAQTITPVVHGGRGARWTRVIGLHVLGATASAALFGAALGAGGVALGAPWGLPGTVVVVGVAGAYALRELTGVPVLIPELRRQVPEWWRSAFSPGTAAALYGVGLGVGFATHLRHGTLVAVAAASAAAGDPTVASLSMGAFGLARSLAVAAAWLLPARRDVGALTDALERIAVGPAVRILNGLALVAVAVVGAVAAASHPGPDRLPPVASAALAVVFGAAAVGKTVRWENWRRALSGYRIPLERPVAVVVPAAEAAVPAAIVAGAPAAGAALACVLLLAFSAAAVRAARSPGERLPCGCFGGSGSRSVRTILTRNLALGLLSVAAAGAGGSPIPTFGPGDALPAILATAGGALTGALIFRATRLLRRDRV